MKTTLMVEIETADKMVVFPEERQSEEDFKGEEKQKELKEFRADYLEQLHDAAVKAAKDVLDIELYTDAFFEDGVEVYIDCYDKLDDYGIKLTVKEGIKENMK